MFPGVGSRFLRKFQLHGSNILMALRSTSMGTSNRMLPNCSSPFPVINWTRGHKTVSSVKKRVRLTGSGHLKRGQAGKRHNTGPKPRSRVRSLGQTRLLQGTMEKKIRWMLGSG